MSKVPALTPEQWDKWNKDKEFAEGRVEHLEDELDKALDEQEKLSHAAEELKAERDAERRLRIQAESDARRAKAAADQAAAAAAAASRSLKMGEKQGGGGSKGPETQELRVEMQQLKARNHGLTTQMDALAMDHERLASLLSTVEKDKDAANAESSELRSMVANLEKEKVEMSSELQTKSGEWETLVADRDAARKEAARLEAQNQRLGDELDLMAGKDSKGRGSPPSSLELTEAIKAREQAEERLGISESQVATLQTELRETKEEVAALLDEAALKAGAAREGLAAADAQTQAATEQANVIRAQLEALQSETRSSTGEQDGVIKTLRVQVSEAQGSRREAEDKVSGLESRVESLSVELTESKSTCTDLEKKVEALSNTGRASRSSGDDEEGTTDQLLEMMTLVKDAERAKGEALEKLDAKTREVDVLKERLANSEGHHANGMRELGEESKKTENDAKTAALQEELDDLHAMLDNVASERDAALNDLRLAGGGAGNVGTIGDDARAVEEEAESLRRECEELREKVRELEIHRGDPADGVTDDKRVQVLEDQVERLSQEHTRQSENWRDMSSQMESEKEELSQELISAKLQVAQLSMEVDGLKLRHRQETIAASEAHAQALENALSPPPSVASMGSQTSPVSPVSPASSVSPVSPASPASHTSAAFPSSPTSSHTMEL